MKKNEIELKYQFNNFIQDETNKEAYDAAYQFATNPNYKYNPLVIYGNGGNGKTHLLKAIANQLEKDDKEYIYVNGFEIAEDHLKMTDDELRNKYIGVDYFIIDDIQFAFNERVREFLFKLTNTSEKYSKRIHIVISSNINPNEITIFKSKLQAELSKGLVVEIKEPGYEFSKKFIKNLIEQNESDLELSEKSIDYIAQTFGGDNRVLVGCITRIYAYANIMDAYEMTDELVKEALKSFFREVIKNGN